MFMRLRGLTALSWHHGTNGIYPRLQTHLAVCPGSPINATDGVLHAHACTHSNTSYLCSYLSLQDVQLPRHGIRSPCRQSCRRSSHSRRSLGHLWTSAHLAADRLPCLPAGRPGRVQVTCWSRWCGEEREEKDDYEVCTGRRRS